MQQLATRSRMYSTQKGRRKVLKSGGGGGGGEYLCNWHNLPLWSGIGLTKDYSIARALVHGLADVPKSGGGGDRPPCPPVPTALHRYRKQ